MTTYKNSLLNHENIYTFDSCRGHHFNVCERPFKPILSNRFIKLKSLLRLPNSNNFYQHPAHFVGELLSVDYYTPMLVMSS